MSKTDLVRFSRDGDQFHYLWAARRCLQLLSLQSDLIAISIEGPSPEEGQSTPPVSAGDEVIDLAEYFGSEEVKDARLIRYMQLKHSTRHATEPWTASGLENTIDGFARRYRELLQHYPAHLIAAKIEFWFVTNRPIATNIIENVSDVIAGAPPRHPGEIRKLERFTGLENNALASFLKLLRFEDRQDDYWNQRNILFQDVQGYLPEADVYGPLKLKELVTRRALSEGEQNPTITKMDVLRALDTDESKLFPAPCLIKKLDTAVARVQEPDIIRTIIKAASPVIIHASAGVGKTVLAARIAGGLPSGSACILYDCFGNGQYRNASGYRHRHKDALVQIANELAAKGLCHLLIPTPNADAASYVRAFVHRITQAATILRFSASHSLLCIVVDAADNAQMAAEEIGEARSFVRDLIREKMPDNVRLVFLCRSHRRMHLDPPIGAIPLEFLPFTRDETASCLRQRFPDANERDIDEFHRLSSHNPRVQALALSQNNPLPDTLRLLGPNPTSVEDTIGSLLESAIAKLRDSVGAVEQSQLDKMCAGLAALRPLIPISMLSKISGVGEDAVRSFALDLGRPLLVTGNTVQFLDEPAETWFRDKFRPSAEAMSGFIANLKPLTTTSVYAASVLPQLMLEAGQFTELMELALTSAALPETSLLERRDVELQRLQFALKAALRAKRYLDAAQLSLKAGGETASDNRQRKILQSNTDLAAIFLEPDLIQELVSRRTFGSGWLGSHHAYEAGLLSGCPALVGDARSRLRMAHEWLRNWSRLTPEERRNEKVSDSDIVELTLAHINIHGPARGAESLGKWRPREVSFRVGRTVARRLIDQGRIEDLEEFAVAAGNNICLLLAVVVELREIQRVLHADVLRRAFRLVANKRIMLGNGRALDDRDDALTAVIALVEASLLQAVCGTDEAAALLSRYLPIEPPRGLSSRFSKSRFPLLRAYCLRAALLGQPLELRDLAHNALRAEIDKKKEHSTSRDLQEFQEDIGALLPWHSLWAATLLGRVTCSSLSAEIEKTRTASKSASRIYFRDDYHTSNEIALMWVDILHKLDAGETTCISDFLLWKSELKRPLFTPTLFALARLLAQKDTTKRAAIRLSIEGYELTKNERSDAEEMSDGYLNAARAVLMISRADANAYFNEAVDVASRIGDENLSRWDSILDLADRAARTDRPSPEIAYQFARCAELTYDYVTRDKHFDWEATVEALCGLCPSSSFAVLSRWRDRNFGWSERILPIATNRAIDLGALDARDGLTLVAFRAQWTYHRLLDRALKAGTTKADNEAVTAYVYRYMRMEGGDVTKLKKVASERGVTISGISDVTEFLYKEREKERKCSNRSNPAPLDDGFEPPARVETDFNNVFEGNDLTNATGLSDAYASFKATERPWHHDQFFSEAIRRLPVGSEAGFIDAVGNTPEFDLYHLRTFLEQAPNEWKERPATRNAMARMLKIFSRRYCMGISKNRHYEVLPFKTACALAGISEAEIVGVVLDAIGESPDLADSHRLFSLVGLLTIKLSEDEALEALKFGLSLFTPVLEDKDGDGPWSVDLLPPADIKASLAGYIWSAMAAPEGVLRWEGAHAVLGLAALGRHEVLRYVMEFASTQRGGVFADSRLPFYSLHALQWLMIGIARAASEFPRAIAPFAGLIVDWALNEQPHVLIRQFAANAALSLLDHGLLEEKNDLRARLANVNISPLPPVDSKRYERARGMHTEVAAKDDDDRFYFGIDIGPYWYAPLGRIFALTQNEIEVEALKVIRGDFRYTAKGRWDEDERSRRNLYEEHHTSHSHGSYPRADTLHFYYAYHAMMVVAGKLLATIPTHRNTEYGDENEFAEWLAGHGLSRPDGRWLWDRRDPTPLEHFTWQDHRRDDEIRRAITICDFDEALCSGDMFNVWGHWTTTDSERQQSVHVRSALVSPDKSLALLRALGTAKDVYSYAIPTADSGMEIDESGFSLKGWIVDRACDGGLDRQDRWSGGVRFPAPRPARRIAALMCLESDLDFRTWRDAENTTVMTSQVWGHYDEAKRHESGNPEEGSRLQASLGFLTSMLTNLKLDLIVEVKIERRRRYRPHESGVDDDKERIAPTARFYLLRVDGRLCTF